MVNSNGNPIKAFHLLELHFVVTGAFIAVSVVSSNFFKFNIRILDCLDFPVSQAAVRNRKQI